MVVGGGGPGSIGLYAVGIAAALGASRVIYVDGDERRLRIAAELGAETIAELPAERLGPFPITVDASADPAGLALAIRSTGAEGVCTSVGIYFQNQVPLPLFEAYVTGVRFLTGRVHARPAIPAAIELIASGRLDPGLVTTRVAGWDEAPAALAEGEFVKLVFARERAGAGDLRSSEPDRASPVRGLVRADMLAQLLNPGRGEVMRVVHRSLALGVDRSHVRRRGGGHRLRRRPSTVFEVTRSRLRWTAHTVATRSSSTRASTAGA